MSKNCTVRNLVRNVRVFGEIWTDSAGNECYVRDDGTISCRTVNIDPSLTIQSEKDACDVNWIVAKCKRTGMMSNMRTTPVKYGDFSSAVDYHDSILRAQEAEATFMSLPAVIRARFSNDPGQLIDFLANPNNGPEAVKLGLMPSPSASKVPQVDASAPSKEGEA